MEYEITARDDGGRVRVNRRVFAPCAGDALDAFNKTEGLEVAPGWWIDIARCPNVVEVDRRGRPLRHIFSKLRGVKSLGRAAAESSSQTTPKPVPGLAGVVGGGLLSGELPAVGSPYSFGIVGESYVEPEAQPLVSEEEPLAIVNGIRWWCTVEVPPLKFPLRHDRS